MIKTLLRYFGLLVLFLSLGACNLGKWMPEGEYRLDKNTIEVDGKDAPDNVYNIIKQKPAPTGENWIYTWGNPNKEKGFSRWVSDRGTPPTVLNLSLVQRTQTQLGYYYFSKGYFYNVVSYEIVRDSSDRDAEVIYNVHLGPQYHISDFEYVIPSEAIVGLTMRDTVNRIISPGDPYDEGKLEEERARIATYFRNNGFYGFSKDWISYTADTTMGNQQVKVIVEIMDRPIRTEDSTYTVPHQLYTIGEVYIDYDFNYLQPKATYNDTIIYKGYDFLIREEETYHPHLITRAIHFKNGDTYNATSVKNSYTHLSSLGVFGASEIEFNLRTDTNVIDAYVRLTPLPKRSFTAQMEGTNTSGNYGIAGNITLLNRNLFGAGEIFDLSLKGGIQAQVNYSQAEDNNLFNTYELGAETGITFSRFLIPLRFQERFPKRMRPTTRINTSYSQQTRIEFQRRIWKVGMSYQWKESDEKTWQWAVLDFNYVNLLDADDQYINSLFFKTGFQDNLILAQRITYTYAPFDRPNAISRHFLRGSFEGSGNALWVADRLTGFTKDPETGQGMLMDVPYAQYIRADLDYRHYLRTGLNSLFVTRAFAGVTYNYGNSPFLPPFEKNYLAGGSQDIRGWIAYRLGPGGLPNVVYDTANYAAVAPVKLMINLEQRFKLIGNLNGACFVDIGNVWLFNRDYRSSDIPGIPDDVIETMKFNYKTFIRQSAVGTGLGLRYDFGFFQLRLDGGIKVWDPTEPEGRQYVLDGLQWRTVTFNFALGYPF
ncbi:translocation and assembly module lipoprotein TamL [Phaeocystidibacter marisrubri]|uniref:BamA/TamA family outer membrane protein n=1 Tax=Phaeocystidibacter marisrubri TaxID=1577780 RepID=A0A6L3ZIX5_9FLAO|nr:BamA/TamA family outer membrane protein [Phaeocystidibacter marisrubri]KAB2817120.1 BamA/TamA family outer membrane protein [Phaeocystidibacter marisrubri]